MQYGYDADGNVKSVLNGTASVYFVYDNLNRLSSRSLLVSGDSTNYTVSYVYDLAGNLLNLAYPDGQGTLAYSYDPWYRVSSMTFGGSTVASFTYRKDDLLNTTSYGDGSLATYVFNGRGFPLENKVTAGSSTFMNLTYAENQAGDITGLTDKAANADAETYGYDKLDRLTSAAGPWGPITYLYDAAGNRLRQDNSAPPPSTLRPNANGTSAQWSRNGCTANWACVDEASSDGDSTFVSTTTIGATDLYRLPSLPDASKGVEYVEVTAVARDTYTPPPPPPPGCPPICPTAVTAWNSTDVGTMSGTADAIYLLVNGSRGSYRGLSNTYGTYTQRWTTDPSTGLPWTTAAVNALQAGVEAADVLSSLRVTQLYVTVKLFDGALYTYSAGPTGTNELTSVNQNGVVTFFYHDANGNIVNRSTVSSSATNPFAYATYTFDIDNRLVKACTASPCTSGNTYTFAYDGLGDRIKETGPSGSKTYTNTYVASGDAMLYLKNVVGTTTTKTVYLYAGSLLIATVSGTTKSYFHEDHLGSTRLVTQPDKNGAKVVFSTNYQPFGVQYASSGTDPSVKYTGQWSEALGLYWNHARFYDPTLGRFVSADPVLGHLRNPQTLDRYAYVMNNPLRYIDPSGRYYTTGKGWWESDWDFSGRLDFWVATVKALGTVAHCVSGGRPSASRCNSQDLNEAFAQLERVNHESWLPVAGPDVFFPVPDPGYFFGAPDPWGSPRLWDEPDVGTPDFGGPTSDVPVVRESDVDPTPAGRILSRHAEKEAAQFGLTGENIDEIVNEGTIIGPGDYPGSSVYSRDIGAMRSALDPMVKAGGYRSIQVVFNSDENVVATVFRNLRPTRQIYWYSG